MASSKLQLTEEERLARDVFTRLAAQADEFEAYAHPHAERVARLADELAQLFRLGRADRGSLRIAALAHDLGELAMRRDYIKRAGPLSDEERLDLARHPVIGEQEAARSGADRGAQLLVRWHQEWWNGAGYPDALSREQIPLAARILRVADAYAALTDDRPHRRALSEEDARRHLAEWAGIEFDPRVVRAFLTLSGVPELRSYARRDAPPQTTDAMTTDATTTDATPDAPTTDAPATATQTSHDAPPTAAQTAPDAQTTPDAPPPLTSDQTLSQASPAAPAADEQQPTTRPATADDSAPLPSPSPGDAPEQSEPGRRL